jgi:hypothetical protein
MSILNDDAIRFPVNKLTALVVAGGESFEPSVKVVQLERDTPLPVRQMSRAEMGSRQDLRGKRFGRFTVVGIYAEKPALWVVRCDCGTYCTRKAKAIQNPANDFDRCTVCRDLLHLRRSDVFRRTGLHRDPREF